MTHKHSLSRRDFVAATALGAAGLLKVPAALGQLAPRQGGDPLLYVGTYTEGGRTDGIQLLRMDSRTGALRKVGAVDAGMNPSFLTVHPNGKTLFAVNEVAEKFGWATGSVRSFTIDQATGDLTALNEQPTEGAAPCYVTTDRSGHFLLVANYTGGTVAMLPVEDTGEIARATHAVQHMGTGPVTARQEKAHAHCIIPLASNKFVLAADLGVDRVLVYSLDADRDTLQHVEQSDAVLAPGTGPRHLALHPTMALAFVSGELNSTVTALRVNQATGALTTVQTLSTLPAAWKGENFPADIHVAPSGKTLYVSNRGHNSIAVFSIAPTTGRLALQHVVSTGGDWPRNFGFDPTGRWLLAANQKSNSITVFSCDPTSGHLTPTSQHIALPSPVCLRFQSQTGTT